MMELTKGFIPPSDTWQVLCEAPGVIWQSQLRTFCELRDQVEKEDPEIRAAFTALKTLVDFAKEDGLVTPDMMEALERHVVKSIKAATNREKVSTFRQLFDAFGDALRERFEAGWLIQMGVFTIYRDHTGAFVVASDPLHPWDFN